MFPFPYMNPGVPLLPIGVSYAGLARRTGSGAFPAIPNVGRSTLFVCVLNDTWDGVFTGVSVNGNAGTLLVQGRGLSTWLCDAPATGDYVVTSSGPTSWQIAAVWGLDNLASWTPTSLLTSTSSPATFTSPTVAGGISFIAARHAGANATISGADVVNVNNETTSGNARLSVGWSLADSGVNESFSFTVNNSGGIANSRWSTAIALR